MVVTIKQWLSRTSIFFKIKLRLIYIGSPKIWDGSVRIHINSWSKRWHSYTFNIILWTHIGAGWRVWFFTNFISYLFIFSHVLMSRTKIQNVSKIQGLVGSINGHAHEYDYKTNVNNTPCPHLSHKKTLNLFIINLGSWWNVSAHGLTSQCSHKPLLRISKLR